MQTAILQAFYSMHLYNNVCMYVCVCVCLCLYVFMCVCLCLCVLCMALPSILSLKRLVAISIDAGTVLSSTLNTMSASEDRRLLVAIWTMDRRDLSLTSLWGGERDRERGNGGLSYCLWTLAPVC